MSRLIVKNLPAYLDEGRLKAVFATRNPVITDVKIVRRPDGTSRRFGFVGFKSPDEALDVQGYFHKTFIDTARIDVSIAKAIEDDGLKARAEERQKRIRGSRGGGDGHQAGMPRAGKEVDLQPGGPHASVAAGANMKDKAVTRSGRGSKSISFDDFMQVMAPRSKRKSWKNEDGDTDADAKLTVDEFSGAENAKPPKVKKAKYISEAAESRETNDAENAQAVAQPQDSVATDEKMTDLEYMYKRMRRKVGVEPEEKGYEQSDGEKDDARDGEELDEESAIDSDNDDAAEKLRQEKQRRRMEDKARKDQEDVDTIMESGRLFVRNLPFEASEEELQTYFSQYGTVTQSHITLDKMTKKSKGIAFVSFDQPSHALAAFRASDGSTFQGRLLHTLPAISQHPAADSTKSVKDSKKQNLKAHSSKDFNWSTLYMSADAVASSVASRLRIDKADILTPQDEEGKSISPAVRLALAETSIIQETREFLEGEGINVDAFDDASKGGRRSDTVILVKNIPFGTTIETLEALFGKHGAVSRIVMPPTGTIAVVEMEVAGEAKIAFKALAYKRLSNSILYLEKAPTGIMEGARRKKDAAAHDAPKTSVAAAAAAAAAAASAQPQQTPRTDAATQGQTADALGGATLFIKNLSFSTTDERLAEAFARLNGFAFARVQKRTTRRRDGKGEAKLSMGYGFAGFRTEAAALAAQKIMDKTMLDGHVLSVNVARRGHDADGEDATLPKGGATAEDDMETAPSAKLIVKNLAFQASKRDVSALFSAHGKLKSVRVPRKSLASGGGTAAGVRGFAFVEFTSRKEALNAFRALRHSHLLGRHLVLDWDTEGGGAGGTDDSQHAGAGATAATVERLREKAARGIAASTAAAAGGSANRREKLRLGEEDIRKATREAEKRRKDASDDDDDDDDDNE